MCDDLYWYLFELIMIVITCSHSSYLELSVIIRNL